MQKVFIIGAGPAGITAGYELLKQSKEYDVAILEESDYIGGISRTVQYNGNRMDIGGHRFFSKNDEVNAWWNEIMPMQGAPAYDDKVLGRIIPYAKNGPDPEQTDKVMLTRSRVSRIYYNNKFFDYPVKMNANTIKNMGFWNTTKAGFSYLGGVIFKKKEDSLEHFYMNRFGKKLYSMFFEGYTEKLWGRHPSEISAAWGAQRVKGLSIIAIIKDMFNKTFHKEKDLKEVETSLIEEFSYPKYGPGQLWECAAEEFERMGGVIHKNCKVTSVRTKNGKVVSVTCIADGEKIEEQADIVISSMPIKDLILGMNNVPTSVLDVARRLPYRDFVTVGLLVPKLNLINTTNMKTLNNLVPDCWIYVQDAGVKLGRIQIFNNWSPYLVERPEDTVWIGLEYFCNEGDIYWGMSEKDWVELGIKELIHMGVISTDTPILDSHKECVKKAYPAYFDTYDRIDEVKDYLNRFDNLYCVGRNGQHRYNNMDHSMLTSFETVRNILHNIKDKSNIWNVNTEQEYHEEKKESIVKAEPVTVPVSEPVSVAQTRPIQSNQTPKVVRLEPIKSAYIPRKPEAVKPNDTVNTSEIENKKENIKKTESLKKAEAEKKSDTVKKTQTAKKEETVKKPNAVKKTQTAKKEETEEKPDAVKKTQAAKKEETEEKPDAVKKTQAAKKEETAKKPDAVKKTQAAKKEETAKKPDAVRKTQAAKKEETAKKPDAVKKTQTTKKEEAEKKSGAVRKVETANAADTVIQTQTAKKEDSVTKTNTPKKTKNGKKTETVKKTESVETQDNMTELKTQEKQTNKKAVSINKEMLEEVSNIQPSKRTSKSKVTTTE